MRFWNHARSAATSVNTGDLKELRIGTLTDDLVANQQAVADRLHRLSLIPNPVTVRDVIWLPPSM